MENQKKMKIPWVNYTPMAAYDKFLSLACDHQKEFKKVSFSRFI